MRLSYWFLVFVLVVLTPEAGFAYTSMTHRILVEQAFKYMDLHGSDYQDIFQDWGDLRNLRSKR